MPPFHFVVHRKVWFVVGIVVGTLLLGAIVVTAQGPQPQSPQLVLGNGFTYQGANCSAAARPPTASAIFNSGCMMRSAAAASSASPRPSATSL